MILGINPYLILNGNGQEAVSFYEHAFDTKTLALQRFGDMPGEEYSNLSYMAGINTVSSIVRVSQKDMF